MVADTAEVGQVFPSLTETEARTLELTRQLRSAEETVQQMIETLNGIEGIIQAFADWINEETALTRVEEMFSRLEALYNAAAKAKRPPAQQTIAFEESEN